MGRRAVDTVNITWNVQNWITIVLMVALGYFVVSAIAALVRSRLGSITGIGGSNVNQGGGFAVMPAQPLTGSVPGINGVVGLAA